MTVNRTISIVSDSYAPFGTISSGGFPEPPEPPRRPDPSIDRPALMKRFGWSEADYESACANGLPTAAKLIIPGEYGWQPVWRESQITRWVAEIRERIVEIERLIGR